MAHFWARRDPVCAICPFFLRKNIFLRRLVFEPSRTAKKAPKAARVGFRSCSSALATLIQLSTRARDPERDGANRPPTLVPFSAHSPQTRPRSGFMPRGTTPAHPTTNGLFFDHPRPVSPIQSPSGGSGSACKISFGSTLFLVQISVGAEGGEGGGNEHAPVVAHRTGHPEN